MHDVWKMVEPRSCDFVGYLITEAGNIDRPIAMIEGDCAESDVRTEEDFQRFLKRQEARYLPLARVIARFPDCASSRYAMDLRDRGYLNSKHEMPSDIYQAHLKRPKQDVQREWFFTTSSPFCPHRFKRDCVAREKVLGGEGSADHVSDAFESVQRALRAMANLYPCSTGLVRYMDKLNDIKRSVLANHRRGTARMRNSPVPNKPTEVIDAPVHAKA